ncbi:MAG: pilus assembly protein TadG-related protein [Pseudomonadota bacterium]
MAFSKFKQLLTQRAITCAVRFSVRGDGTVTIFGILMFILMIAVGGVAVDIMRYETQRVQLQYTLDRAVLAAASMNQTLDPEDVVLDYFARSGLPDRYRISVDVDQGLNYRSVSATAEMDINNIFMDFFGIRALTSPAAGAAEERLMNVEISLVLDVSGSMGGRSANGRTKLENLQTAATDFVTTVMAANDYVRDEMLVSISVIPYAGFVNAGSTVEELFPISSYHTYSSCTRFRDDQFTRTGLGDFEEIDRLAHFDYQHQYWNSELQQSYCPTDDENAILPWSHSIDDLHDLIAGLEARGWTAIDQGMRWGVTLLDPSSQDELDAWWDESQLTGIDTVHEDFRPRPESYDDDETLKIVVLMTDGANTLQIDVADGFREGPSTIYYHDVDERWSMYLPDQDVYWIPDVIAGDSTTYNNYSGILSPTPYVAADGSESEALSWPWMWANFTNRGIALGFYNAASSAVGDWSYRNRIMNDGLDHFDGTQRWGNSAEFADQNLRDICDAANTEGIVIYSIAFEAPLRGQSVMQHCASSDGNYFNVEGVEISEAFDSIASVINRLRLTQ